MWHDFIEIITQCVSPVSSSAFFGVILLSAALGALCWFGCSRYTRLWHRRFHVRPQHHILCGMAAILTVVFTIVFDAVGNLEFIVNDIIDRWSEELVEDDDWGSQTYEIAFHTVKQQYPREFSGVPEPDRRGSYIPFSNDDMMQLCVETYVEEACADFSTLHPFLDRMLRARSSISEEVIVADIRVFFRENPGEEYPSLRAVEIAAEHIRENLLEQSPKTVWKTRLIVVLLFLAVQLIPFGMIGWCAYQDLNIGNQSLFHNNKYK